MTTVEAAKKWGVKLSRIHFWLSMNLIPGATKVQRGLRAYRWFIPDDAEEPSWNRIPKQLSFNSLLDKTVVGGYRRPKYPPAE